MIEPRAFGGWLILALLALVAAPLRFVAVFVQTGFELRNLDELAFVFEADNSEWLTVTLINLGSALVVAALAIVTMVHAFPKKQSAIR